MDSSSLTIIEKSGVAPLVNYPTDKLLPLTFFDSSWFRSAPVHSFLFYKFHSADRTIIPSLKKSLSMALSHYYPLAGNLMLNSSTSSSSKLEFRYSEGDSVPLTIAEYRKSDDFTYFAEKNTRNVRDLLPLIPHLPPTTSLSDSLLVPLLALQLTIFPKEGICIAFTLRHVACDGSTLLCFKKAWASIHKNGSDEQFLASGTVPSSDRSLIADDSRFCKRLMDTPLGLGNFFSTGITVSDVPSDMLLISFSLSRSDIENLKRSILAKYPNSVQETSFVATLGFVWSCLAKSRPEKSTPENEKDYFLCPVDCRTLLNPPLPETYFGNCVLWCFASINTVELLEDDGFIKGAVSIGEGIHNFFRNIERGEHLTTMTIPADYGTNYERLMWVAGSPKFKIFDLEFFWGKPKRFDTGLNKGSILVNQSKDLEGGLEICLSLPEDQMNAFSVVFADVLQKIRTSPIISLL